VRKRAREQARGRLRRRLQVRNKGGSKLPHSKFLRPYMRNIVQKTAFESIRRHANLRFTIEMGR
jgi:hypothetical protein